MSLVVIDGGAGRDDARVSRSGGAPACPRWGAPMGFVARLEEGSTGMNFGAGGCGYAFAWAGCVQAAFLWQSA